MLCRDGYWRLLLVEKHTKVEWSFPDICKNIQSQFEDHMMKFFTYNFLLPEY